MKFNVRKQWDKWYAVIIPTICTILYVVYCFCAEKKIIQGKMIQNSKNFEDMLNAFITFMSITLSMWGILIPLFVGAIERSYAVKFFIKKADMDLFIKKLKSVFGVGMITIFVTCMIFLKDIYAVRIENVLISIWIWLLLNFICNSYRFIGIIISLLVAKKKTIQNENPITEEREKEINNNLSKTTNF